MNDDHAGPGQPTARTPDWQLPPGVDRGAWDYAHNSELARGYDESLRDSPLFRQDLAFCQDHFPEPGRLIDLGCGTGRLVLDCARRGWWGLGVDLSFEMLTILGEKASAEGLRVARLRANLVELDGIRDASFDAAACLFSTLGMIHGHENRRRVLEHVRRILKPGGVFVLHVHNRWFQFGHRRKLVWLMSNAWSAVRGRAEFGDWTMPQRHGGAPMTLHHFTKSRIASLLKQLSFRIIEVRPVSTRPDGRIPFPWLCPRLRAYGYLIAATVGANFND